MEQIEDDDAVPVPISVPVVTAIAMVPSWVGCSLAMAAGVVCVARVVSMLATSRSRLFSVVRYTMFCSNTCRRIVLRRRVRRLRSLPLRFRSLMRSCSDPMALRAPCLRAPPGDRAIAAASSMSDTGTDAGDGGGDEADSGSKVGISLAARWSEKTSRKVPAENLGAGSAGRGVPPEVDGSSEAAKVDGGSMANMGCAFGYAMSGGMARSAPWFA